MRFMVNRVQSRYPNKPITDRALRAEIEVTRTQLEVSQKGNLLYAYACCCSLQTATGECVLAVPNRMSPLAGSTCF